MIIIPLIFFLRIFGAQSEKIVDPTLKPTDPFSAAGDAGMLREEMKQDATVDRDKISKLWFHRVQGQRAQIEAFYNSNYCQIDFWGYSDHRCPLKDGFDDISTQSHNDLYTASLLSPQSLLGITIYKAIIGKWKEIGAIEEIVCGNDHEMKYHINDFYNGKYHDTVENHLGTFRKDDNDYQLVMKKYCWAGLCQDKIIKPEDADREAQALRAINPETDKEGFKKKLIDLLDHHCEPDLKMIFEKYRKDKDGIDNAVDKAFEVKRVRRAYNRLVRYIENTCKFYSDELNEAVDKCGTNIDKINRIILTRCERDLRCILNKYKESHNESFTKRLTSDTIGEPNYRDSIRWLCGD